LSPSPYFWDVMGTELYINNVILLDVPKSCLESTLEEKKYWLEKAREDIRALVFANISDLRNSDEEVEDWLAGVQRTVDDLLERYDSLSYEVRLMEIALENPEDVTESM